MHPNHITWSSRCHLNQSESLSHHPPASHIM
nr:MAG TPA: hypothetical protein [Caudoviricetes sp.]